MLISDSKVTHMKHRLIISVLFILAFSGCVKENFDQVPEYTVDYESNTSIANLKALYSGSTVLIDTNLIIKGIVTADDQTGNFYKELYIQDETGAINVRLDETDLYTKFPIGRLVYIKCKDLAIDFIYQGVMQIGWGTAVDRIPSAYMSDYKVPDISSGGPGGKPKLLTIATLNDDDLGKLIKLENVQFVEAN